MALKNLKRVPLKDCNRMDTPLDFTLRDLFFVVGIATSWLPHFTKEGVFQWLCYEMERRVPEAALREAMEEAGFIKDESCVHCNETIKGWDFEEDGEQPLCKDCLN